MADPIIQVFPDPRAVAVAAAERVVELANQAIDEKGKFSIALAGGSTPKALYELLASDAYRMQVPWGQVHVYFGDERCVPPEHADSNYRMANEAMLKPLSIPTSHIHRMHGELEPEAAAIEYGQLLKEEFADGGLDLCLLGMGDDGHTASLFPHTTALAEQHHRCVANHVPKLNVWRITLTAPFINRSAVVMFLVTGANKAKRVQEVLEGPREPERLPSQLIHPTEGKVIWMLDVGAAGMKDDET